MIKLLIRFLTTAALVMLIAYFMPSVQVADFETSFIVAVVLGLLNIFVKPILVVLTFPVTVVSLGLFLLIINAIIILICTNIVDGFTVASFWSAIVFSIILSISQSIANLFIGKD